MIDAINLFNHEGELLFTARYRFTAAKDLQELFRANVLNAALGTSSDVPPIVHIPERELTLIVVRTQHLFAVASTCFNVNTVSVSCFLDAALRAAAVVLGVSELTEGIVRREILTIQDLFEEMADHGYPNTTDPVLLSELLSLKSKSARIQSEEASKVTVQATGAVSHRRAGIVHKTNQVWLDVNEKVNALMTSEGNVLRSDVTGVVEMNCELSGMPDCKFTFNDRLVTGTASTTTKGKSTSNVVLDSLQFHQCVRLSQFDASRSIAFIPPDGKFTLMRYRIANNVELPFRVTPLFKRDTNTLSASIALHFTVDNSALVAPYVIVKVPMPAAATEVLSEQMTRGTGKLDVAKGYYVWRLREVSAKTTHNLSVTVQVPESSTAHAAASTAPIQLSFSVPGFASSGIFVQSFQVSERKMGYKAKRWVRYMTDNGDYGVRVQ